MYGKKWSTLLTIIFLCVLIVTACSTGDSEKTQTDNLSGYFPLNSGIILKYQGEGNEYASFTRKISYLDKPYIQFQDNNGGTITANVYRVEKDKITRVLRESEFYSEENLIPRAKEDRGEDEIILKSPLKEGSSWDTAGKKKEIIGTDEVISVPAGVFHNVIKVEINYPDSENTGYEYYAKNIGLIMTEYIGENFKIASRLSSIENKAGDSTAAEALQDASLYAYQLEREMRAVFRSAFESYINMERISDNSKKNYNQITAHLRNSLQPIAVDNQIRKQIDRLNMIERGGEGEMTFPAYEVVNSAEVIAKGNDKIRVRINSRRYFPEREWSGKAYSKDFDYVIELVNAGKWKVNTVEINR